MKGEILKPNQSVILEKELDITEDPRGVALAHDAVRICWHLGLGSDIDKIGHGSNLPFVASENKDILMELTYTELPHTNFHKTSFANTPFFTLDTRPDDLAQALPSGIFQFQPMLGKLFNYNSIYGYVYAYGVRADNV